jgi:integrase
MSERMKSLLKLLLLTGQRNGEVAGAKWEEFDLREKWWTIPGTRTKNKKRHQVF